MPEEVSHASRLHRRYSGVCRLRGIAHADGTASARRAHPCRLQSRLPGRSRQSVRLSCKKQLESGYLGIVNNIHHRRFPLIDEERGVVWSNCVFDMDGTVAQIKLNTGEVADMSSFAGRASSIHVSEAFRIENNLIRRVEMIGTGVPYHFNSSWGAGLSGK